MYRLVVVAAENAILRTLPDQLADVATVQLFESANEALWNLRDNPPEALIAEVDLPGMTGLELAEIIPNFELPTRVVLWSDAEDADTRQAAEAAGVFVYLHGPLSVATLREQLAAAVGAARVAVEAAAAVEAEAEAAEVEPEVITVSAPPPPRPAARPALKNPPPPAPPSPSRAEPKGERRDFTPARVTLPSVAEREAAAAPPPAAPPAKGGLASRTRAAAERKPEPKPEPKPAPAAEPAPFAGARRSAGGNLVVTAENINPIRKIMSQLGQELGAQSIMLTDRAGMVLVEVGSADGLPMMIVLPLLSTSFATSGEVSRMLREEDATTLYIHEGVNYDLYCFDVVQRFLLVIVFNKKVASSKIGSVWVGTKRSIRELRDALDR